MPPPNTKPPKSAPKEQLELWSRVLSRRVAQLQKFPVENVRAVLFLSTKVQRDVGAVDKSLAIIAVQKQLVHHFHQSVDDTVPPAERRKSLQSVKAILAGIDLQDGKLVTARLEEKRRKDGADKGDGSNKRSRSPTRVFNVEVARKSMVGGVLETNEEIDASNKKTNAPAKSNKSKQTPARVGRQSSSTPQRREGLPEDGNVPRPKRSGMGMTLSNSAPSANSAEKASSVSPISSSSSNDVIEIVDTPPPPPKPTPRPRRPRPTPKLIARNLYFKPDTSTPTLSASLAGRSSVQITYDAGCDPNTGAALLEEEVSSLRERFETWDPYWMLQKDCSIWKDPDVGCDVGVGTGKVVKYDKLAFGSPPLSALNCKIYMPANTSVLTHGKTIQWGRNPSSRYQNGERRLIARMLPLHRSEKDSKKRADTHLWPKGTFIQVNGRPVQLQQRKQQSHDPTLWKGMCHVLDVTGLISNPSARGNTIEMCTRDGTRYGAQIGICEYVSADALFEKCLEVGTVREMSYLESVDVALGFVNRQMVVLESDDEDENEVSKQGSAFTMSLKCPISMNLIATPVRGKSCRHMQCFDLLNYLHSNVHVSGGRWRCGVCEVFVPLKDLVLCGLYKAMLAKFESTASVNRDKVQIRPDGTWDLMNENKMRYTGRKRGNESAKEEMNGGGGGQQAAKKRKQSDDVIDMGDEGGEGGQGHRQPEPEEIIIL